jgi:hypothetical protein
VVSCTGCLSLLNTPPPLLLLCLCSCHWSCAACCSSKKHSKKEYDGEPKPHYHPHHPHYEDKEEEEEYYHKPAPYDRCGSFAGEGRLVEGCTEETEVGGRGVVHPCGAGKDACVGRGCGADIHPVAGTCVGRWGIVSKSMADAVIRVPLSLADMLALLLLLLLPAAVGRAMTLRATTAGATAGEQ